MKLPFEGYLRRKDAYEAADTGIILWRKNFYYFIIFFAIPFWICAFGTRLIFNKNIFFSWIIIWYLKPFFDRFILHVISIKFFEPDADFKRIINGLFKNIFRGLFGDLLWRRFTPFRSVTMPIRILEPKNKSNNYSKRKQILKKGGLGYGFFLTSWGLALEAALFVGGLFFISLMAYFIGIPLGVSSGEFFKNTEVYIFSLWCFNYILVESIYVCMGFGIYINSRIEVEGWDLEIIFKGFAEKLKKKKMLGVLSVLLFLFLFVPQSVMAQESLPAGNTEPPLQLLEEVFSSPDFGYERDSWTIKRKNPPEPKERITIIENRTTRNNFFEKLAYLFASALRIFLIVFFVAASIFLIVFFLRYYKKKKSVIVSKPVLTILHKTPRENPQKLLDKAISFYKQSQTEHENYLKHLRNAWGLCTSAAILSLELFRNYKFPPNATEMNCAKIAANEQDFCLLIKIWVNFAYGGILPPPEGFEASVSYCKSLIDSTDEVSNG